jgi:hypothetical protein
VPKADIRKFICARYATAETEMGLICEAIIVSRITKNLTHALIKGQWSSDEKNYLPHRSIQDQVSIMFILL